MTSYNKMATVQEKAMCVLWFFETTTVTKTQSLQNSIRKRSTSDNSIRRLLKQFQEAGSVLYRKRAGRPSTSPEDVDPIREPFSRSPQKSTRGASLQLDIRQTNVWRVVYVSVLLNFRFWSALKKEILALLKLGWGSSQSVTMGRLITM
jgi:hypothetical protein